jgi:hypothetical protein
VCLLTRHHRASNVKIPEVLGRMNDNNIELQPERKRNLAVERRLEFIDFRLAWYGRFNRKDVVDIFGLSPQQASADIASYSSLAPENLEYDTAAKSFVRKASFQPLLVGHHADRYLLQILGIRTGLIDQDITWFETLPDSEIVALERRPTDFGHLQKVLEAIEKGLELEIDYSSINSGLAKTRCISPHAIFSSDGKWYVRAWSRDRNDFRDFNLNRIGEIALGHKSPVRKEDDFEWNLGVDLHLQANPLLGEDQRSALETEYNMSNGILIKPMRLSLAFYLINSLNLDLDSTQIKPNKQQLILTNLKDVESKRTIAREMSLSALRQRVQL